MKKMNFLKFAFTIVMAFAFTGVFAQYTGHNVEGDGANFATNWATTGTVHMIEGTTIPLFADPDNYFHPDYDNGVAEDYTLNDAGFTWVWTEGSGTLTITQIAPEDNYVTVTAADPAAGVGVDASTDYTINVLETAPAAWGGCDDGVGTNVTVTVHNQPLGTINDGITTGTASYNGCVGDPTIPVGVAIDITEGWQNYRLVWSLEIKTLNADGTDKDFYDNTKAITVVPPLLAENYTTAIPEDVAAKGSHDITVAGGFTILDNSATVYTYTYVSINDQASRFGQFIAKNGVEGTDDTFTYYPTVAADQVVTIRVNPTPTTGPIYHINSGWSI